MPRVFSTSLLAIGMIAGTVFVSSTRETYVQHRCDVSDRYVEVWMDDTSAQHSRWPRYSVQFNPQGLVLAFPGDYYAPGWDQIDEIIFKYSSSSAVGGILTLKAHDLGAKPELERIGTIDSACWTKIKIYLKQRVESTGVRLHISEHR